MTRVMGVLALACLFLVGMGTAAAADQVQLSADLSGANEIGDPGDAEGAGSAVIDIDSDTSEVCFNVSVSGTEDPVAAHIHVGTSDENGDVVVDFDWAANAPAGCVAGDPAVVSAILADPAGYYVNVHTPEFPAGAVRGQLVASAEAETELAQTGTNLTVLLSLVGVAAVVAGSLMLRTVSTTRRS